MRKMLSAALVGLTVAGGAFIAETALAQPYGYYTPYSGYYGQNGYNPRYYNGYNGYYANPNYNYYNGYNGYNGDSSLAGIAGAVLGSVLGADGGYYGPRYDRYGYDPNGMIRPDGRRIKCKNRDVWDSYYGGYVTRRVCR